jgi:hypothetical protein
MGRGDFGVEYWEKLMERSFGRIILAKPYKGKTS